MEEDFSADHALGFAFDPQLASLETADDDAAELSAMLTATARAHPSPSSPSPAATAAAAAPDSAAPASTTETAAPAAADAAKPPSPTLKPQSHRPKPLHVQLPQTDNVARQITAEYKHKDLEPVSGLCIRRGERSGQTKLMTNGFVGF